ncbi:Protein NLRC3 [Hondaea fermentalgiana]|uniref:Protein NLRC3 n=1 Tax=Hondaea fermentalgiana TaxID=2315210 RepID=A0A2R5GU81_9STRA|nr:Protein NLRC3 [Hondaea fermentalgiana]|eukprot:GBG34426.1 Protein NLRC3 [Hondaea fermentalgiana]
MEMREAVRKALAAVEAGCEEVVLKDAQLTANELASIVEVLQKDTKVRKLDLSGNPELGSQAGDLLRSLLQVNASLEEIDLSGCSGIGANGVGRLAGGLRVNMSLRALHLRNTEIGGLMGSKQLSRALRANCSLEHLDLRMNGLGPRGIKHLAKALAKNQSLQVLNISENDISDEGAVLISKTLRENRSLEKLDMWRNGIGEHGASHLREAVRQNSVLQTLNAENVIHRNDHARRVFHKPPSSPTSPGADPNAPMDRQSAQLFRCLFLHTADGNMSFRTAGAISEEGEENEDDDGGDEECESMGAFAAGAHEAQALTIDGPDAQSMLWESTPIEPLQFSPEAFRLARDETDLFVWCIDRLSESEAYRTMLHGPLRTSRLWLQEMPGDLIPMAHLIMGNRESPTGAEMVCTKIFNKMTIHEGRLLFKAKDSAGRTFRSLASGHASDNVVAWAKGYGTYLLRYDVQDGPPVHESKTCAVHFATDIVNEQEVALKIMKDAEQFRNELISRGLISPNDKLETLSDVLEASPEAESRLTHVVPIVRAHCADKCIVMPRATRSLFEAINTEQFVGRQLGKIRAIAHALAVALLELQVQGRIHADIKPRNFVRVSKSSPQTFEAANGALDLSASWRGTSSRSVRSDTFDESDGVEVDADSSCPAGSNEVWQLIDLDASVKLGELAGEKHSSGYCPPELARNLFPHGASGTVVAGSGFDVWSFGAILYQMLSGTKLFMVDETDDNLVNFYEKAELCNWIAIDRDRLDRINNVEWPRWEMEYAKDLVRGCLMGDPSERLQLADVLKHPFFTTARGRASLAERVDAAAAAAAATVAATGNSSGTKALSTESKDEGESISGSSPPPMDATRRILSFRVKVEQPSGGGAARAKGLPQRRRAELETVFPQRYHYFLSHMQKEAAGIVKDLYLNLTEARCLAWIDMHAEDLTQESMRQGVENSSYYVLVLTRNVLFRPFCVMELFWAIQHHGDESERRIFFIVEEDSRFSPWNQDLDVPWLSTGELAEALRACKGAGLTSEAEASRTEAYHAAQSALKAGLQSLLESDARADPRLGVDDILCAAKKYVTQGVKIPYRRRAFEEAAMIEELLAVSSYCSPHALRESAAAGDQSSQEDATVKDVYILYHESGATVAKELASSMRESPGVQLHGDHYTLQSQVLATAMVQKLQRRVKADALLIILLKDGFFNKGSSLVQEVLQSWVCEQGRPFVMLQYDWSFGGPEQEGVQPELRSALFDLTEIMPYRKLERKHEHHAMLKETKRRLMLNAARYEAASTALRKTMLAHT